MRSSLFVLILAVLFSSTLAMPDEDRDEQKSPKKGILHHLLRRFVNGICPDQVQCFDHNNYVSSNSNNHGMVAINNRHSLGGFYLI